MEEYTKIEFLTFNLVNRKYELSMSCCVTVPESLLGNQTKSFLSIFYFLLAFVKENLLFLSNRNTIFMFSFHLDIKNVYVIWNNLNHEERFEKYFSNQIIMSNFQKKLKFYPWTFKFIVFVKISWKEENNYSKNIWYFKKKLKWFYLILASL